MTDEKKLPDEALDAVTGGLTSRELRQMAEDEYNELLKKKFGADNTINLEHKEKQS